MYGESVIVGAVALDDETLGKIERTWWVFLVGGSLSVLFGVVLLSVDWTIGGVVTFYGLFLLFWGVFRMGVSFLFLSPERWLLFAMGAVAAVLGLGAFIWPGPTLKVIALLIGWWLIVTGLFDLVVGLGRWVEPRWLYIVRGGVAVLVGLWALWYPARILLVLIFVLGIMMVVYGIVEIVLSFQIKHLRRRIAEAEARALEQLARYAELADRGLISAEEFDAQRRRLGR